MRRFLLVIALTLLPTGIALAADGGFVPIAPIPLESGQLTNSTTLEQYVNGAFKLALAAGSTLAVIMIMIGGFEYIFSEAMGAKQDGKKRITDALYGLALLLLVYLILYIINPDIVQLKALQ